jgi:outer membrane protein TolC
MASVNKQWTSPSGGGLLRALAFGLAACISAVATAAEPAPVGSISTNAVSLTNGLSLLEARQRVLDYNESIQGKILGVEIARKRYLAEKGIFEPQLVGSAEAQENNRTNNAQQQITLLGTRTFAERNNLYNGGLEFLGPSGGQLRIGYTLRDLQNNLQRTRGVGQEFETFLGFNVTQPLLKNFGPAATLVKIRLAAAESDVAFQDYRRQMMLIVSQAEAAYWDLYLTQEQFRISQESVEAADKILKDNRQRVEVGKASELEVLEAQAGYAYRTSKRSEAEQKMLEAINRLSTLYSESALDTNRFISVADRPEAKEIPLSLFQRFQDAFDLNPDYLSRKKQVIEENIRLAYAKNQRYPQLDLKSSFGLNGLGDSPESSFTQVERTAFPSWSVSLELRVPLGGGIRERNQLEAARLSQRQALIGLKEIEVQIVNAIDLALSKVRATRENIQSYESVADFNQKLLETQMVRLDVGKTDSRTVLETEQKLFEAKIAIIDSLVQYQKALLELDLVTGVTLRARGLDLTKEQLQMKTTAMLKSGRVPEQLFAGFFHEAKAEYEKATPEQAEGLRQLRQKMHELQDRSVPPAEPDSAEQDQARQLLRQKMQELEKRP